MTEVVAEGPDGHDTGRSASSLAEPAPGGRVSATDGERSLRCADDDVASLCCMAGCSCRPPFRVYTNPTSSAARNRRGLTNVLRSSRAWAARPRLRPTTPMAALMHRLVPCPSSHILFRFSLGGDPLQFFAGGWRGWRSDRDVAAARRGRNRHVGVELGQGRSASTDIVCRHELVAEA